MRRRGFVMIIALVYTMILAVVVTAMAYFIASETRGVGFQLDDTKALYLAQAGVERAFREIRDEVLTPPQTGLADLRGADTTLSTSVTNVARIHYIRETSGLATFTAGTAILSQFDSNYTNTGIISVQVAVRASRASSGTGATIQVAYTTDGSTYTTVITQALTTTVTDYFAAIPAPAWPAMMSTNFRLRCLRSIGTSTVNLDALYLRVSYSIDTNTEPWYTGTYTAFPMTLGDGFIQSVSIVDEARKVHLNYASQLLLRDLMQERGVNTGTANTLATNIVSYRGASLTNPFDSIEELQQVSGMTQEIYDLIKDYVTVHSFINTDSYRPPATGATSRAPININTATPEVLRAVFDPILTAAISTRLADDIVTARTTAPFTCFYNSNTAVTTDFYDFINSRSYLSAARRNQILDNADASLLIPVPGYGGMDEETTEFCYANTTYKVDSVGRIKLNPTENIDSRVQTIIGNDGSRTLPTYVGDTVLTGYWKESYE